LKIVSLALSRSTVSNQDFWTFIEVGSFDLQASWDDVNVKNFWIWVKWLWRIATMKFVDQDGNEFVSKKDPLLLNASNKDWVTITVWSSKKFTIFVSFPEKNSRQDFSIVAVWSHTSTLETSLPVSIWRIEIQ
jgi:hypothetical protein